MSNPKHFNLVILMIQHKHSLGPLKAHAISLWNRLIKLIPSHQLVQENLHLLLIKYFSHLHVPNQNIIS